MQTVAVWTRYALTLDRQRQVIASETSTSPLPQLPHEIIDYEMITDAVALAAAVTVRRSIC